MLHEVYADKRYGEGHSHSSQACMRRPFSRGGGAGRSCVWDTAHPAPPALQVGYAVAPGVCPARPHACTPSDENADEPSGLSSAETCGLGGISQRYPYRATATSARSADTMRSMGGAIHRIQRCPCTQRLPHIRRHATEQIPVQGLTHIGDAHRDCVTRTGVRPTRSASNPRDKNRAHNCRCLPDQTSPQSSPRRHAE
jgi:hypothetical protein